MQKKFYLISFTLLTTLILLLISSNRNINLEKQNQPENSIVQDNNSQPNDSGTNEINENSILGKLILEEGIIIEDIKDIDNKYIAIGSKSGYPYMQLVNHVNNSIESQISTSFTKIQGKFIDVNIDKYFIDTTILDSNNEIIQQKFIQSNNQLIPFYKEQLNINYSKGIIIKPEYIVIHETANTSAGADADAHYRYWSTNPDARASAHFVVDSTQIYQMLELNQMAWHVGDNKGYSNIINSNTIGIEIAVNSDGDYDKARQYAIDLTIELMKELNMDITQLKMHNDASGKLDPITMLNDTSLWTDFVNQVRIGLKR